MGIRQEGLQIIIVVLWGLVLHVILVIAGQNVLLITSEQVVPGPLAVLAVRRLHRHARFNPCHLGLAEVEVLVA